MFDFIPAATIILFVIAIILAIIEALLWLPLKAKIGLRIAMWLCFVLGMIWQIFVYENGQVSLTVLGITTAILTAIGAAILTRWMTAQAKQLREYRARAEEARQRGAEETAALYDKTAKMIARPLGRIKL